MHTPALHARAAPPVVYLDRDGVINENRDDYVTSWEEFRLLPGALDALRLLTEHGFTLFIVTNQSAVNRGLMSHNELELIHRRLVAVAEAHGARISDIRYCPHRRDELCHCRKPRPGMLQSLAFQHRVSSQGSFMVGDALSDVAAGRAAGCRTVMVRTGRGDAQLALPEAAASGPEHVANSLADAARWIVSQRRLHGQGPHADGRRQAPMSTPMASSDLRSAP